MDAVVSTPRISRFSLVTADPQASISFLRDAFDASLCDRVEDDPALPTLLGLPDARVKAHRVRIGDQTIELLQLNPSGRPYPVASTSSDLWFQHFAIIVSDIEAAYARLEAAGRFTPISKSGPVRLPPASGAVSAFKFRDAEGHPLELLEFPDGTGPDVWQDKRAQGLFLGIDHSAIAVRDGDASIAFFERAFGLKLDTRNLNEGAEQAEMDDVPGARVAVVGLAPKTKPPHVELLAYEVGSRRPIEEATRSNDIAATQIVLEADALDPIVAALTEMRARFVSPGVVSMTDGSRAIMVLDPDGHRFRVVERRQR